MTESKGEKWRRKIVTEEREGGEKNDKERKNERAWNYKEKEKEGARNEINSEFR